MSLLGVEGVDAVVLMLVVEALAEIMLPRLPIDMEPTRRMGLFGMGIIDSMEPIMRGPLRLGEPISMAAGEGAEAGGTDVDIGAGGTGVGMDVGVGAGAGDGSGDTA